MKNYILLIIFLYSAANVLAKPYGNDGRVVDGQLVKQYSLQQLLNLNWLPEALVNELVVLNADTTVSKFSSTITYSAIPSNTNNKARRSTPPTFPGVFNEQGDVVIYRFERVEDGMIWVYEVTYTLVRDPSGNLVWIVETEKTFKGFDEKYFDIK
jgi:hypothetical protein